jgi:hypothetical protein
MSAVCWAVCKTLLDKQPPPQRKKLLGFLPASQRTELQKAPVQGALFSAFSPDEVLDTIHPSWLVHILHPYTENEKTFFLATLQPVLAGHLKKLLSFHAPLPTLSTLGKEYLRRKLLELVRKERGEALPKAALPGGPLNILLTFDAYRLSLLTFWLGLYDLAEELRFVIDKQTLFHIETALTPVEWQAVKSFQVKKERVTFGRMNLKETAQSPQKLRLLIEQYGMNRLAKALYGENESMLWHLLLRLDHKRAEYLSKLCVPLAKPELKEALQHQLLSIISLLPDGQKKGVS